MTTLKARFNGRVLVPETPVDLPVDTVLEIQIVEDGASVPQNGDVTNGADQNAENVASDDAGENTADAISRNQSDISCQSRYTD